MKNSNHKTLRQKFLLWLNNLHFSIMLRRKNRFFEIILHEKYKKIIKSCKYVLIGIGLVLAFFTFQSVIIAFLFGLAIFLLSQFLEKILFSYNSLYIQPMPTFTIESDKWLGVAFGYAEQPNNPHHIPFVGWALSDADYARKIHSALKAWSYGNLKDDKKNICMSVIIDENDYIFFSYPSPKRETASQFFDEVEKERKQKSLIDIHHKLFCMLIFGKRFKMLPNSYLLKFRERYRDGTPFLFRLVVLKSDDNFHNVDGLEDLILFNLKIKDKKDLAQKDIEYDLLRILG